MSFNTAQLYDSQDLTSEGISSPGYSVSSSLDGLNNPPNWNFVYRQECFDYNAMLEMLQAPQSDNWFDFEMLQPMNNGAYPPNTPLMLQHQYETGEHPMMKTQVASEAPDIMRPSAFDAPPNLNFADAVGNGWSTPFSTPIRHNNNIYEPPSLGENSGHVSSFQDGTTASATTTTPTTSTNHPLSQPTGFPPYSARHDNHSPNSETTSTTTSKQESPACYDWGPSPTTQQCYFSPQKGQSAHLLRNAERAMEGLKEMERSLKADTKLRISQVKQSLPS